MSDHYPTKKVGRKASTSSSKKRKPGPMSSSGSSGSSPHPGSGFAAGNASTRKRELPMLETKRSKSIGPDHDAARRWAKPVKPRKKIIIKPFKVKPVPPESFVDNTITRLHHVVSAIHANQPLPASPEILYRSVHNLCLHSKSLLVYEELVKQCEAHIQSSIENLPVNEGDKLQFLLSIRSLWNDHCKQMKIIQSIFMYLDRSFVIQNPQVRSLWKMGLNMFRKHFLGTGDVQKMTLNCILDTIKRERSGETVDAELLESLLKMYSSLTIYRDAFEESFLRGTTSYYREEGNRLSQELEVPAYLEHVCKRLNEEKRRTTTYINESSFKPLILTTEVELLKSHTDFLYKKGFDHLIEMGDRQSLARMYDLFGRVGAWECLQKAFASYIIRIGRSIVSEESKDSEMIERILGLKSEMDGVLQDAFSNNPAFLHHVKEAFEQFINTRQNRPSELLAKYIDRLLRHGVQKQSVSLESVLDDCMVVFRYMHGKDIFEAFYKKDLSKRLLLNVSSEESAERHMIAKLKCECGARFTNNIECMFQDIKLSKELMEEYRRSPELMKEHQRHMEKTQKEESFPDFEVSVLTTSSWPVTPSSEVRLPAVIKKHQEAYESFYLSKNNGRKLSWQQQLGQCVLRASFQQGRKELALSSYQAVVLLQFNEGKILTFSDLLSRTGIDVEELKNTLTSLTKTKARVLKKRPTGPVSDRDQFTVNLDFQHKLFRVRISQQTKETVSERSATNEKIFADRIHQIDAAVVRIMKARKTLSHALLISEVISALKFPVEMSKLKKRIGTLLERDYIERCSDDSNSYNYVA